MAQRDFPHLREYLDDLKVELNGCRNRLSGYQSLEKHGDILFYQAQAELVREKIAEVEYVLGFMEHMPQQTTITIAAAAGGTAGILLLIVVLTLLVNTWAR